MRPDTLAPDIGEEFVLQTDQVPEFWQFLNGLRGDDLLVELIVNELDARSTETGIRFEQDRLVCGGNGDPIDDLGWKRLAYIKGAGLAVPAKVGLFGVKNHGLKACFTIGDDILLRSAGQQILQTLFGHGTNSPAYPSVRVPPRPDPDAPTTGTRIEVPYRRKRLRVTHGEAFEFAAVTDGDIERLFTAAVETLPKRLLGIMRPGMLDRYRLVISHHQLGTRTFVFSAGRVRREAGLLTFFRECNEELSQGTRLVEREQACLALSAKKSETKPRFFQAEEYKIGRKRLFSRSGLVIEVAWDVDAHGTLGSASGRLRYPVAYPGSEPASGSGTGAQYSGPFVSDTERHELAALSSPWNDEIIGECDATFARALAKVLVPRHGAKALELVAPLDGDRLLFFANHLVTAHAFPAVDQRGKTVRHKRGAKLVIPTYENATAQWAPALAKVAPAGLPILDSRTPPTFVELLASNACDGWDDTHLRFDGQDVLNRLEQADASWFPWRSEAEWRRTLGDPKIAHAHLEALQPYIAGQSVAERPTGADVHLPDTEGELQPLSDMRRGASIPTALLELDVPPIIHPALRNHPIFKLEGWHLDRYALRDLLRDGGLAESSTAVRKRFFAWLAANPGDLARDDWPAVKALPVWPAVDGSARRFEELCLPEARLATLLGDHIARPTREVRAFCTRLQRTRVRLTLRDEPTTDEIRAFYEDSFGQFPTDRPLDGSERSRFHALENMLAVLGRSRRSAGALRSLRDTALALNRDGLVMAAGSLVRGSPEIARLALQSKDLLDRPAVELDAWLPPARKPTPRMAMDALVDEPGNRNALLPRLAVITTTGDEQIIEELRHLPCLPYQGRLAAPDELAFKGNAGEFWGGWKLQIGAEGLSDQAQDLYRAAGVIRGNPTPANSRAYFEWLLNQPPAISSAQIGCIIRHLHHPSGVGAWLLQPPELPCMAVEAGTGVELLTLSAARRIAVVNDVPELGDAIRQDNPNPKLRLAIDSVAGAIHPVADELRRWGIPTLSSLAKEPINPLGQRPEPAPTSYLDKVRSIGGAKAAQRFRKQLKELDVQQSLIEPHFPSRLLAIRRVMTVAGLSVQFRVRGRLYRAPRQWAVLSDEIWLDREGDLDSALMEAIADVVFRKPRPRYLSPVLREALSRRARDFKTGQDSASTEEEFDERPGSDEIEESSKPHPGSQPDPNRNSPHPGELFAGPATRKSKRTPSSNRTQVGAEDIQRRQLKIDHYASHCQMELARRPLEQLAPAGSYAEFAENRIRMLEAHHPDKASTSGARHAGNLLILSKVNHDAIGTTLSRADITDALRNRWTPHQILRTDGTIWLKGGIATAIDKVKGDQIPLFFTDWHRKYWLEMAPPV